MKPADNQKIIEAFLTDTFTVNQAHNRLRSLKRYLEEQFFNPGQSQGQDIDSEDLRWLRSLDPDLFKNFTPDNLYQLFTELEKALKELTSLVIYLAFEPGPDEIRQIGHYLRTNFKTAALFDLKTNPELIGGCALVYRGVYRDYSIRARIEANKAQIMANLKSFLKK